MHNYNKVYDKKPEPIVVDEVADAAEEIVETVDAIAEAADEVVEPIYGVVCNCKKLRVRKNPKAVSEVNVLCEIAENTKLIVDPASIDADNEWLSVCTETGVAGYCKKEYVRIET